MLIDGNDNTGVCGDADGVVVDERWTKIHCIKA
jgi:hypothetical protein